MECLLVMIVNRSTLDQLSLGLIVDSPLRGQHIRNQVSLHPAFTDLDVQY